MLFNKKSGYHFFILCLFKTKRFAFFFLVFSERKIGAIRRVKTFLDIRKVIADDFDIAMEIRNRRVCCYIGVDHDAITRAIIPAIFENVVFYRNVSHSRGLAPKRIIARYIYSAIGIIQNAIFDNRFLVGVDQKTSRSVVARFTTRNANVRVSGEIIGDKTFFNAGNIFFNFEFNRVFSVKPAFFTV